MLDLAIKYEKELRLLFLNIALDEKYLYLYNSSYRDAYTAWDTTWKGHEFVSIHNDKILGYMKYSIDRDSNTCFGLQIVNFYNVNLIFSKDLKQFLVDIFEKYKFRKLKFGVFVGNPIEKSYDKLIKKFNGRIVGIYKEDDKLLDGEFYDYKAYEILRRDYLKLKNIKGSE